MVRVPHAGISPVDRQTDRGAGRMELLISGSTPEGIRRRGDWGQVTSFPAGRGLVAVLAARAGFVLRDGEHLVTTTGHRGLTCSIMLDQLVIGIGLQEPAT